MRLGGNKPFKTFMDTYGPEGGYVKGMGIGEKYKTWAAREYREKVSLESRILGSRLGVGWG